MGTRGREIVGVDVDQLLEKLNRALADEWLAYYQYWVGSKVLVGPMRGETETELIEHAADELRHADMLVDRIVKLGGTPILEPKKWYDLTNCGYNAPEDPSVKTVLDQNIEGEQCAIGVYKELMDFVEGKDFITYEMVAQILADEVEHEDDLQNLKDDLKDISKYI